MNIFTSNSSAMFVFIRQGDASSASARSCLACTYLLDHLRSDAITHIGLSSHLSTVDPRLKKVSVVFRCVPS
jgi:hypothetical protein